MTPATRFAITAAKALDEIADQEPDAVKPALSDLVKALADTNPKTRYYAVKALGKLGADAFEVVAEVEKLTNDSDESVAKAADSAAERIKKKHSGA